MVSFYQCVRVRAARLSVLLLIITSPVLRRWTPVTLDTCSTCNKLSLLTDWPYILLYNAYTVYSNFITQGSLLIVLCAYYVKHVLVTLWCGCLQRLTLAGCHVLQPNPWDLSVPRFKTEKFPSYLILFLWALKKPCELIVADMTQWSVYCIQETVLYQ